MSKSVSECVRAGSAFVSPARVSPKARTRGGGRGCAHARARAHASGPGVGIGPDRSGPASSAKKQTDTSNTRKQSCFLSFSFCSCDYIGREGETTAGCLDCLQKDSLQDDTIMLDPPSHSHSHSLSFSLSLFPSFSPSQTLFHSRCPSVPLYNLAWQILADVW